VLSGDASSIIFNSMDILAVSDNGLNFDVEQNIKKSLGYADDRNKKKGGEKKWK
jgi:hypothetical protein